MTSRAWALCLLSALPLLWAAPVRAQEDDAGPGKAKPTAKDDDDDPDAPSPSSKPTEGAKGEAHESLVPPKPTEPEEPPPVGPVERLPPTAYPEWQTRGITGGSLWLSASMHGMPWPYYPKTGIGVSGSLWLDTGYSSVVRGNGQPKDKHLLSQGRGVLRVTPTFSDGEWYLQGQSELVANKDQTVAQPNTVDIDDLWVRAGKWKSWNVQLGRFEAFEVYHFGMGMDVNTLERYGATDTVRAAPDVFELGGASNIVYRQDSLSNLAVHFYPTDNLRFEVLGQYGFDKKNALETVGVRPAGVFDLGWFKLKAAADFRRQFSYDDKSKESRTVKGAVAAAQFVFDPNFEFGANFAYGQIEHYGPTNSTDPNATRGDFDTAGSVTDLDVGGFANVRIMEALVAGGGVNYNQETDQQAGTFSHLQPFGAIQYVVMKQLYLKLVGAYAKAHLAQGGKTPWDNTMTSVRLRAMLLF
ncbi:MAG: hypothetical protein ABJB12_19920 [Pseudomonadota bacterium]